MKREFEARPCARLKRVVLLVRNPQGREARIALARITMPKTAQAKHIRDRLDANGTGQIVPADPSIRLTGRSYRSTIKHRTVIVAEAEPIAGQSRQAWMNQGAQLALDYPK